MDATAGTPVFGIIVMFSSIRVFLRTWQSKEMEGRVERLMVSANPESDEAETEGEKMTPYYMPPPRPSSDNEDILQKIGTF